MILFNKPFFAGKEIDFLKTVISQGKLSGNGLFTEKCEHFLESNYGFKKTFLTSSCTDALEMAAILLNIAPGDEVILPSYTFVSTANPFVLRGARVIFADSGPDNPNVSVKSISELITKRTKAVIVVHYAGVACDMEELMKLVKRHRIFLIEDAAQAIDAFYKDKPLGSFGHLAAFSFHDTKNITSGEGGMLVVNDPKLMARAEILREKGTNRAAYTRGELKKYEWVDIGSSFLPSEITAAFLYAQLQKLKSVTKKRVELWNVYYKLLKPLIGVVTLPDFPAKYIAHNASIFYIVCRNQKERKNLAEYLKNSGIQTAFHYVSLHTSAFYKKAYPKHKPELPNAEMFSDRLLRLPLYYSLTLSQARFISRKVIEFYKDDIVTQ